MSKFPYLTQESLIELLKDTKMMKTLSPLLNVFKCPQIKITELSAIGTPEYETYPQIEAQDIYYRACGGNDYEIYRFPEATIIYPDRMFLAIFDIPVGPSTSPENFWTSVLEYKRNQNLYRTVINLGKYSMGVNDDGSFGNGMQIGWTNGNLPSLYGGNLPPQMEKGSSMTFVVDPSYLQPEMYDLYETAKKAYERDESPLLI